jgi:thiosulfate reductase cytochrome b subunit
MRVKKNSKKTLIALASLAGILLIAGVVMITDNTVLAQSGIHPVFPFLDLNGENVLESGNAVSTMETCGQCHDTDFIVSHSYHVDSGFSEQVEAGTTDTGRAWDTSPGLYGNWNPITYYYLSPEGDEIVDLTPSEWAQTIGVRHVGGGPTEDLGTEMNCFLCHLDNPNTEARRAQLAAGSFEFVNTATLLDTGIVNKTEDGYIWVEDAFDEEGNIKVDLLNIQEPDNENCGICHGSVDDDIETPLNLPTCKAENWTTQTTGQIMSPQRISESALNLADKDELSRPWDVHVERMVNCADCHYSLNNPVFTGNESSDLDHLQFDPRRLGIGEYLYQPVHDFAHGLSAQSELGLESSETIRTCEYCHSVDTTHEWLPYQEKHMEALNCGTCHIPEMYSTARMQFDWTIIGTDSYALTECRGVEDSSNSVTNLITGFTPVVMPEEMQDGAVKLSPYNLVSSWFWVYGEPERPVRIEDLETVWLDGTDYAADVVAVFDSDGDGVLADTELTIDTKDKEEFIAGKLEALGLDNPRIKAEVQPYSISHNVVDGKWVTKDCQTCHSEDSLLTAPIQLASYLPGGVSPEFIKGTNVVTDGEIYVGDDGALYYQPSLSNQDLYIFGKTHVNWVDWYGVIALLGVLGVIVTHGGLRVLAAKKAPAIEQKTKKVYMYSFYERLWHWLQTIAIVSLAVTGFIIHKPDLFAAISFKGVVFVHNTIATILAVNAVLALFYNLVSGDIKRFVPEPKGIFNQTFAQVKYYASGIFKGEEHPIEKTRDKRLNVLQKISYFGILNVLLPLQGLTGILMWGTKQFPEITNRLGGLPFLAPFHTLVAWTFAAFMIGHVYLTTTGVKPLSAIKAMFVGYEDIEDHPDHGSEE